MAKWSWDQYSQGRAWIEIVIEGPQFSSLALAIISLLMGVLLVYYGNRFFKKMHELKYDYEDQQ